MNPDPACGDDFFDREKISALLLKRIDAFREGYLQNVALLGRPYLGKTTLLERMVSWNNRPDMIFVYVPVEEEAFSHFARRFMGMMLFGYFQATGNLMPQGIEDMIKAARRQLPNTTRKMQRILGLIKRSRYQESFQQLLTLTADLSQETKKKIVLILDEFSRLENFQIKDPFTEFGKQMMVQRGTMYIVASSQVRRSYEIFNEKLSLLFGNFETIEIKPFSFDASRQYLQERLYPLALSRNLVDFILRLTNGYPYYLSVLVKSLREQVERQGLQQVTEGVLIQVLENELFYTEGGLARHFACRLSAMFQTKRALFVEAMAAIALGNRKSRAIAKFLQRNAEETKKILVRLVADEFVQKDGDYYFIEDSLFCFWLEHVYHLRRVALRINKGTLVSDFRRRALALMKHYAEEDSKELTRRVEELFTMFQNETLEINQKRYRFPSFSQIVSSTAPGRKQPILAKSPKASWLCQVAAQKVTEEDVWSFIEDLKNSKMKLQKKILVAPYGIDMNAKLLAKESKISLWRLKDLNYLLDLFKKPKLIPDPVSLSVTESI